MSLLSTFTTNSINILAGVNGIEVSQSLVIALSLVANDLLYLPLPHIEFPIVGELWHHRGMSLLGVIGGEEMVRRHLLSLYFMGPLVGVCVGLLYHNWSVVRLLMCGDDRLMTSVPSMCALGILPEPSQATPFVISPG
jgi:UDP-N-acetylglucosamine--dolichyl-phosphate N-acetylglucosaminephosphotransferase